MVDLIYINEFAVILTGLKFESAKVCEVFLADNMELAKSFGGKFICADVEALLSSGGLGILGL